MQGLAASSSDRRLASYLDAALRVMKKALVLTRGRGGRFRTSGKSAPWVCEHLGRPGVAASASTVPRWW
jgi:hypothetical protein